MLPLCTLLLVLVPEILHAVAPLVASGRGMACAAWHGGPGPAPGMGKDCVHHGSSGSGLQGGGPW
jgi:hypothetical protein